jgi:hypothetical protein
MQFASTTTIDFNRDLVDNYITEIVVTRDKSREEAYQAVLVELGIICNPIQLSKEWWIGVSLPADCKTILDLCPEYLCQGEQLANDFSNINSDFEEILHSITSNIDSATNTLSNASTYTSAVGCLTDQYRQLAERLLEFIEQAPKLFVDEILNRIVIASSKDDIYSCAILGNLDGNLELFDQIAQHRSLPHDVASKTAGQVFDIAIESGPSFFHKMAPGIEDIRPRTLLSQMGHANTTVLQSAQQSISLLQGLDSSKQSDISDPDTSDESI